MNKIFASFFLLILCSCKKETGSQPPALATDNPLQSQSDKLVDSIFRPYASQKATAGFSLALIDGLQVSEYNYGETKKGNGTLPNNQTLYEIGSVTKTFAAAATVLWLNQNGIDLNAPVAAYLPASLSGKLSLNGTKVSFKNLLNHTSGLARIPDDLPKTTDPYNGYDSTKVYQYIASHNLLRTPGTLPATEQQLSTFYSNLAYGLLGLFLERQYQTSLQTIFQRNLFSSFAMNSTTLGPIENVSNKAYPHTNTGNAAYWHLSGMAAAGGLKSTLWDMIKYVQAQINATTATPLGQASLLSHTPSVQVNGQDCFGLGWEFYYTHKGRRVTVKDGGTDGFTAFIAFDPGTKKGVVVLFNNGPDNNSYEPVITLLNCFFQ